MASASVARENTVYDSNYAYLVTVRGGMSTGSCLITLWLAEDEFRSTDSQ